MKKKGNLIRLAHTFPNPVHETGRTFLVEDSITGFVGSNPPFSALPGQHSVSPAFFLNRLKLARDYLKFWTRLNFPIKLPLNEIFP